MLFDDVNTTKCFVCGNRVYPNQWAHKRCRLVHGLGIFRDWPDWAKWLKNCHQNHRRSRKKDVLGTNVLSLDTTPEEVIMGTKIQRLLLWRGGSGGEAAPEKPAVKTTLEAELELLNAMLVLTLAEGCYLEALLKIQIQMKDFENSEEKTQLSGIL